MSDTKTPHEEVFLQKLKETHLLGRSGFLQILTEVRGSVITRQHLELREAILDDAKGLSMPNHQEVLATLEHIKRQGVIANRCRPKSVTVQPCAASVGGHAV